MQFSEIDNRKNDLCTITTVTYNLLHSAFRTPHSALAGDATAMLELAPVNPYSSGMRKSLLARWRTDFLTGLAVVLPAIVSIAVFLWLFGTISRFTDTLLFFLPTRLTHAGQGAG